MEHGAFDIVQVLLQRILFDKYAKYNMHRVFRYSIGSLLQ